MAACVVVISDTNQLLYLRTAECPDPLFYHFKAHSALDVIEDKLSKRTTSGGNHDQLEQYLGLLYPMEDHRIYGYVTNTKIKFIMIFESHVLSSQSTQSNVSVHQTHLRDVDVRAMFQRLHTAYIALVCSPFYKPGTPIQPDKLSAAYRFDQCISSLLATNASSGYCSTFTNLIDESKTSTGDSITTRNIMSPKA
ncbi:unnamed protein product [Schistosoma curassoni]|uniref:Trafficking protein particle complex subunit 2-like protein n=1 Tax=Schistosoma curassoni TaxID=6186 RepID=A0A183JWQ6_9TREM|nr:unnamed protein product [Schistosoma curassoni]VDP25088.1 unnamed protein product [Schistosoma curassoni]